MNKKVLEHKCDTILGCNCNVKAALKDIVEITFHKKSTYFFQIKVVQEVQYTFKKYLRPLFT